MLKNSLAWPTSQYHWFWWEVIEILILQNSSGWEAFIASFIYMHTFWVCTCPCICVYLYIMWPVCLCSVIPYSIINDYFSKKLTNFQNKHEKLMKYFSKELTALWITKPCLKHKSMHMYVYTCVGKRMCVCVCICVSVWGCMCESRERERIWV